jgi:hypothetical protein
MLQKWHPALSGCGLDKAPIASTAHIASLILELPFSRLRAVLTAGPASPVLSLLIVRRVIVLSLLELAIN